VLALLVESVGFRVPPADPHSLVGVVLLSAALGLGPENGAFIAALSGLLFGIIAPLLYGRSLTPYLLVARPFLRSGVRAIAILAGAGLAQLVAGSAPSQGVLFLSLVVSYPVTIQLSRAVREWLQGGSSGFTTWLRSSWRASLSSEIAPLPVAWLGAAIYQQLEIQYFIIGSISLLAASIAVRRAVIRVQSQRRSVRELAVLNQVSRAIIRADMDVDALCDLIYREASKLVDTSSFHLGLFDPQSDQYTLVVRVQERVRLPAMTIDLPTGDGIVGWMRQTGKSLLVEDFSKEMDQLPARPRYQSDRPPRAGIYVPLSAGETIIGTISIQSYRPRAFDGNDLRMLSLIADQAAVAIDKARAYDQANKRATQLQAIREVSERMTAILDLDELLPSVVRLIHERFGYQPVHIFTIEDDNRLMFRASTDEQGETRQHLALRVGDGIVGTSAASGNPVLVNDVTSDPRYITDNINTRAELAVPLRFGDQRLGVLDVQSTEPGTFTDDDLFIMQTLAGQIAVAIESARAFTAQREEAWTLNALLQVAENVARASSLGDLLPAIVRLPPLLLGCDRCYCLQWDQEQATYTPLAVYGIRNDQRPQFINAPIPEADVPLLAHARVTVGSAILNEAQANASICPPIIRVFHSGTLIAIPLTSRGLTLGMLIADYDNPAQTFPGRTLTLYAGIANQFAGALESALLAEEAAEAAHLEEELRVARDIQTALLPASVPEIKGWGIAADWRSARLVGGDFYDFWRLQNRVTHIGTQVTGDYALPVSDRGALPLGFVIADVSDKGVPAAMFMTLSRSLVRAAALDGSSSNIALSRANRWITRDSESGMFVTLFYGILDVDSGTMRYTCAGHNPPLLVRADGTVEELTTPGIALGVLEEATLVEAETRFDLGDVLVCYTDGVTESINGNEEAFGVPRMADIIVANRSRTAVEIMYAIEGALATFTEGRPPFDDITMVIIKRDEANQL
jgi:serine phosphatase RsbU (regulator of sigma subunit)/putative methionine-R-sulfoxide reductase with GAF domain